MRLFIDIGKLLGINFALINSKYTLFTVDVLVENHSDDVSSITKALEVIVDYLISQLDLSLYF